MRIHLIAIGGAVMHNMALALHRKGYIVSGSDDEIFEPARGRLAACGLLPEVEGWDAERITSDLDAVILGMHARADNPELLRAKELGLPIYSFPEYIYEQSKNKTRIVIGGSHGKTTITAMIMHVMRQCGMDFDYMVGSQLEGFDTMVRLSETAPLIVLEGDEYLSSPLDLRPKFHLYLPHIALITGIAWDHINVFPTFANYVEQFRIFIRMIQPGGSLVYCSEDKELQTLANEPGPCMQRFPYTIPPFRIEKGVTILETEWGDVPLKVFGAHNLMNIEGARRVCLEAGVPVQDFYRAIQSFKGAAKRLELLAKNSDSVVYKDFAHSPSKLKATVDALHTQYPQRKLVACMELHTFSSLNRDFLPQYKGSMDHADVPVVYFNPHTIEHKKLKAISPEDVIRAFGNENLRVFTDSAALQEFLLTLSWKETNLLLMSSGNFDGIELKVLAEKVVGA